MFVCIIKFWFCLTFVTLNQTFTIPWRFFFKYSKNDFVYSLWFLSIFSYFPIYIWFIRLLIYKFIFSSYKYEWFTCFFYIFCWFFFFHFVSSNSFLSIEMKIPMVFVRNLFFPFSKCFSLSSIFFLIKFISLQSILHVLTFLQCAENFNFSFN